MFYRSGWLRCDVFNKYLVVILGFELVKGYWCCSMLGICVSCYIFLLLLSYTILSNSPPIYLRLKDTPV